jgi:hypothetical protein
MLQALEFLGGGLNVYDQVNSMLNPVKMPDFPRLDQQGNQPQPTPQVSPENRTRQFASARSHLAERGVYSGGAAEDPLASGLFTPEMFYGLQGFSQAMPYEDDAAFGGLYGGS